MKGIDIVVKGSIGHMGAFMGQAGRMVVCGHAGEALAMARSAGTDGAELFCTVGNPHEHS